MKFQFQVIRQTLLNVLCAGPMCALSAFCLGVCSLLSMASLPSVKTLLIVLVLSAVFACRYTLPRIALFAVCGFCWASVQFSAHLHSILPAELEGVDLTITGYVEGLPVHSKHSVRFRFRVEGLQTKIDGHNLQGAILQLNCYRCPLTLRSGDYWRLTLRLKQPHGYASWGAFDYQKYLFRHRIAATGYTRLKSENRLLESHRSSADLWRMTIKSNIQQLTEPGIGRNMMLALIIGDRSGFSRTQRQVLQDTGVSHLIAISGLHVGLVYVFVSGLISVLLWPFAHIYRWLPRQWLVMLPALGAAVTYSALAGFAVSTQRALVMLTIYVMCRLLAREQSLLNILMLAMTALLLIDPFSVLDTGFWLSCVAVFLIALSNQDRSLSLMQLQPRLWSGMIPASVLFFGQISLVSPLVNLLMVPLYCVILIPATLTSAVALFLLPESWVGLLFSVLSWSFEWIFEGLQRIADWPSARWYTKPMSWWQWGIALACLVGIKFGNRVFIPVTLCLLLSLVPVKNRSISEGEALITLLDVGQGLAMVFETADSVTVYDTGPKFGSGFTAAQAVLIPYLRYRGIREIDTLVISHADTDHIGGVTALVDAITVRRVVTSRPDKLRGSSLCQLHQQWSDGLMTIKVLSPSPETPSGSNNQSCVLLLSHFSTRLLITGDIEKPVERLLLQQHEKGLIDLRANIMLVPHQGSKTSSTGAFLDRVNPELALVAAGYRNHYRHPHSSVIERYQRRQIPVLSTITSGTIQIRLTPYGWTVSRFRVKKQRFWHYQKVSNRAG